MAAISWTSLRIYFTHVFDAFEIPRDNMESVLAEC